MRILSNSMLILSEADVRICFPVSLAIAANRKALASLRNFDDGGAVVPTRIGLSYPCRTTDSTTSSSSSSAAAAAAPADWTLFKPASYYPPEDESDDELIMGMKIVSIRANNPKKFNKPTVPATAMLINAETGEVSAIVAATFLTAARTAAGSALATEIALSDRPPMEGLTLVVFGAGLQAELHIKSIQHVVHLNKLVIVNRSLERAKRLKELLLLDFISDLDSKTRSPITDITTILLSNEIEVKQAVETADIIATTTNTNTPLFRGEWLKSGCHINGVGSYTSLMQEVDETSVKRSEVLIDTKEALDVGDLACLKHDDVNFTGLIGDALIGRIQFGKRREVDPKIDCTFFKSVGTAIQDVFSAQYAVDNSRRMKIGVDVQM